MVTTKTALLRRPHLCAEAKAGNTTAPRPSLRRVLLWARPTPWQTGKGHDTVEPLYYSKMEEVRGCLPLTEHWPKAGTLLIRVSEDSQGARGAAAWENPETMHNPWRHMGAQDTPPEAHSSHAGTWGQFLSPCGSPITPRPREAPPPAHLAPSATPPPAEVTQSRHRTPSLPLLCPRPLPASLH